MSDQKNQWDSQLSFIMAMIGSAIGLGNIWRYPYVVYTNGGGAFLIPYIISIIFMAFPYLLLEYSLGYNFKTSLPNIFKKIQSKLECVGWFICLVPYFILMYYIVILAWDLVYFCLSFTRGWGANTDYFFTTTLLHSTTSLSGISDIIIPILLALLVMWFILWYISHQNLSDGIGKYSKFLIPTLVIIMVIIVFVSLTLPGANVGYNNLFEPNWITILDYNIWLVAAGQILFSLSLGWGVVTTYSSYLPEGSNLIKNGLIVTISNCGFELFTAIGVFSILGFMSVNQGIPLENLVTEGSGLIFVAFPQIFNVMGDIAYIIGPLFFLCVLFAGITTTISLLEPLTYAISNKFNINRKRTVTILCLIGFVISIIFSTGLGNYLLTLADSFLNQFAVLFGIILECLIVGWLYSIDKLLNIINQNTRFKMGNIWIYFIKFIIPIIFLSIWIVGLYDLFETGNILSISVQLILALGLILGTIILSNIPEKNNTT